MSAPPGPVLVCGLGQVGYRVTDLLLGLGRAVVVLTEAARDERRRAVGARGARVLLGDARDETRLEEAGLREASALVAVTSHDVVNVEIALDAKRLRPDLPIVVRLFDQQLARHFEQSFEIRRALGVSALAAPTFAAAALGESWIGSFEWAAETYVIGRVRLDDPGPLDGRTVADPASRDRVAVMRYEPPPDGRATVVARREDWRRITAAIPPAGSPLPRPVERRSRSTLLKAAWSGVPLPLRTAVVVLLALIGLSVGVFRISMDLSLVDAFYFIVTTVTTTGYGDITPLHARSAVKLYACLVMILGSAATALLYSIITDFVVRARFRELLGRERIPRAGHVVVAGLGNVGYRTAEELLRAGSEVVVIDREPAGELVETIRGRAPVVAGDARLPETLERAGISGASALVAATGDDAVNLGIALAARELAPGLRTDVRLFDADFARKARAAFRLDRAMSASLLAAPMFVASALHPGVLAAFVRDDRAFVILRAVSASAWEGRMPSDVGAEPGGAILWRRLPGQAPVPAAADDSPLRQAEELVVVSEVPLA